jgi:hypothetical protein
MRRCPSTRCAEGGSDVACCAVARDVARAVLRAVNTVQCTMSPGNSWDGGTLFNKIKVPKRMGRPKGQGGRRWDES